MFLTRSELMSEEITQEIFIKIWTHRSELTEINYFNSWLKTVIRNFTYNYLRRIAHEKIILANIQISSETQSSITENTVTFREYEQLLQKAIDQLPEQQKKAYLLSRKNGLKYEAIATEMNLSPNTVKKHIRLAIHSIQHFLDSHTDIMILVALALFFKD